MFIEFGVAGQSISIKQRKLRFQEHIAVNLGILNYFKENEEDIKPNLRNYLIFSCADACSCSVLNFLLLLKPSKKNLNKITKYDELIKNKSSEIYSATNNSKVMKLLHKTKFNYFVYLLLHYYIIIKMRVKLGRS
jgi:hypothetical protein